MKSKNLIRVVIVVLAVLLASSIIALGALWLYNRLNRDKKYEVTIPDNYINSVSEEEASDEQKPADTQGAPSDEQKDDGEKEPTTPEENPQNPGQPGATAPGAEAETPTEGSGESPETAGSEGDGTENPEEDQKEEVPNALALQLHNKNHGDNIPFEVNNMFPGDVITKYYCVKVSYTDVITMRFRADTRPGFEKLAQALKCKVVLMNTGKTLYNGTFQKMPTAISYQLPVGAGTTTAELYYKITVYLDTSVGNEYQNTRLVSDFRWWVEETGNLEPPSQTGDGFNTFLLAGTAVGSGVLLLVLWKKRRRL